MRNDDWRLFQYRGSGMTRRSRQKTETRAIMAELGIKYTQALRIWQERQVEKGTGEVIGTEISKSSGGTEVAK
jgi:hypothetical protein